MEAYLMIQVDEHGWERSGATLLVRFDDGHVMKFKARTVADTVSGGIESFELVGAGQKVFECLVHPLPPAKPGIVFRETIYEPTMVGQYWQAAHQFFNAKPKGGDAYWFPQRVFCFEENLLAQLLSGGAPDHT
jgi:hypothetical protein